MNPSATFIGRPVATTLLTIAVLLAGALAFFHLPVSPLPQVDYPTIEIQAQMAGASPDTMAATVATPLEHHLGQIADVTEMTSQNSLGATEIVLQFGLNRNIDGAARDVQAAINAARADLPASLRSNPSYHKYNPADSPVLLIGLTSKTLTGGQLYDSASTVLAQTISQVAGVGNVQIGGSALPAVRVELNPQALFKYGIGLEDVRAALAAANANSPKGAIDLGENRFQVYTNDQARDADQYRNLIIAYRDGSPVRLSNLAEVSDGVENIRNFGLADEQKAVLLLVFRQPNANIIETAERVTALLPTLKASVPNDIDFTILQDRTVTIRASLNDVEHTLIIAVLLVIAVVFIFLRNGRATLIPAVVVPVSLIGTFAAMYLLGYSIDNLSLMALTIATGFVVDDAIVVLENISRHIEAGKPPLEAAIAGAGEVGFTVLAMSLSLIAVFIPILLMGGLVGRYFQEFANTLSVAVLISLVISLTTTPMMCALLLKAEHEKKPGRFFGFLERGFNAMLRFYDRTLHWVLKNPGFMLVVLLATIIFNVYMLVVIPKGFFPQEDTGRLVGGVQADQGISFQSMQEKVTQFAKVMMSDPSIAHIAAFTGGRQTNSANFFITLKPLGERKSTADQIIDRLRPKLGEIAGARLFLASAQEIRVGGRSSNALYQYTLQSDDLTALYSWATKLTDALGNVSQITDVNSDQQRNGLGIGIDIDRDTAARLGLSTTQIDSTLYDAFGQRSVSTIYNTLNQYHVIMEVAPSFWQTPDTLKQVYVSTSGGAVSGSQSTNAVAGTVTAGAASSSQAATVAADSARNQATNSIATSGKGSASTGSAVSIKAEHMVPLGAFASFGPGQTPLSVNHQGPFVATTISFNLAANVSLSDAQKAIEDARNRIGVPASVPGSFQGTAGQFQKSLSSEPVLILAAITVIYIVLGVLYESFIHPLTILSTLPSAGAGAVLALRVCNIEFSLMALIGVILLIGIVKKNAIMMIDFALERERTLGLDSYTAIHDASMARFRPIMMTTMAAMLGAVPLAIITGAGGELRQPLGISIVGGLIVSQALTLYTTPVIYLELDRLRLRFQARKRRHQPPATLGHQYPQPGE